MSDEPRHLGLTKRSAGRIMVAIAYIGVAASLIGAVVGWRFLGELSEANKQGLELAEESLNAADASLVVADDIVQSVDGTLEALNGTILAVGAGIDATTSVAGSVSDLAGSVPATLDRIDDGLASIESIATTIDTTLSQLSRIPLAPTYDPDVELGEAVGGLRADISPLADSLRGVSDSLATFSTSGDDLEAQLDALADGIADVQVAVSGTTGVIDQARVSTADALALAQTTLGEIGTQLAMSRLFLVIIALVIAVGQIVPYWMGRELLSPARPDRR